MTRPSSRQLILPSLCADALALGSHWIYNPAEIARLYPDGARNYDDPRSEYHPGKSAGDFTHYGDQTMVLLNSVVAATAASMPRAGGRIGSLLEIRSASLPRRCHQGHPRLPRTRRGCRFGKQRPRRGFAHRSGACYASDQPLEERIAAARAQTALTHGDRATIDTAEFFTRAVDALASGKAVPRRAG